MADTELRHPGDTSESFANLGITTVLTSRDEGRGKKAVELLNKNGLEVVFHNVANPQSVEEFASWLSQTYGSIDILVNNAGLSSIPGFGSVDHLDRMQAAKAVLETNYYGVKRMIDATIGIMKPGARIVNISSKASDLNFLNNDWKARLEDISSLTADGIEEFLKEYLQAVEIGVKGWPAFGSRLNLKPEDLSDYSVSKMVVNAYSRLVDRELSGQAKQSCFVNCMCPGVTSASMSSFVGHPVEVGADTAVWLALLSSSESPSGKFFMNRKDVGFSGMPSFVSGKLMAANERTAVDLKIKH